VTLSLNTNAGFECLEGYSIEHMLRVFGLVSTCIVLDIIYIHIYHISGCVCFDTRPNFMCDIVFMFLSPVVSNRLSLH